MNEYKNAAPQPRRRLQAVVPRRAEMLIRGLFRIWALGNVNVRLLSALFQGSLCHCHHFCCSSALERLAVCFCLFFKGCSMAGDGGRGCCSILTFHEPSLLEAPSLKPLGDFFIFIWNDFFWNKKTERWAGKVIGEGFPWFDEIISGH